jgi:hypothetical protein
VREPGRLFLDRLDDARTTPTPPAKSMNVLPSTSVIVAFLASAAKTGR